MGLMDVVVLSGCLAFVVFILWVLLHDDVRR